ncbi:MAG: DUF4355 domain-containing protein [Candidatus Promineofilum sp.]|uniref:capsid assembly scaffolding protein Gp46 family protein n=1 Tax=Promineifilum sp. TaxID=2664178 RepID=UPI002411E3F8|nr:DUF4355 domain-containing protein [Promineifilum sp.]
MADQQQADEQEIEQDAQQSDERAEGDAESGEGGAEKLFTQAELDQKIAERLRRAKEQSDKAAAKAAADAQRKANEEQGKYKELYEGLQAQLTAAEGRAAELERAALRREAAEKSGLPAALAERLRGETLDEMLEDAKLLRNAMPKPQAPDINAGPRGTTKQTPSDDEIREQAAVLGVSYEHLKQQYGGD